MLLTFKMLFVIIFFSGWAILLLAIAMNYLATSLGIMTWQLFLENARDVGLWTQFKNVSLFSKLFLFIIYPSLLAVPSYFIIKKIKIK